MRPPRGRSRKTPARLPRGLHEARRADGTTYFYTRACAAGEDRRVLHETEDLNEAKARHHDVLAGMTTKPWTLVEHAWARWMELARGHWKPKNRDDLQGRFDRYVRPLLGKKQVRDLTGDHSRQLAARLRRSGLAARTQSQVLTQWSSFAAWLVDAGYVRRSPVPRGLRPKVQEAGPDPLTDEEVEKVLRLAGEPHAFAVRLILATGLRWSDLVRLQAADLKPDGWLVLTCSKTGKLLRVPLGGTDPDLACEVRRRVGRLVPFSGKTGAGTFNAVVRRRTGVRFTTYRAKDRFACAWLSAGGSLTDLQQVLGHADPKTTMRYGRPSDRRLMSEGQRVGSAWRPVGAAAGAGKDGEG